MIIRKKLCLLATLFAITMSTAQAKSYAMTIGINQYAYERPLDGAVNDAKDIALALKQSGINNVKTFLNNAATKQAIQSRWNTMVRLSKPGDKLIVSYSGHGVQRDDKSGDEADRLDEVMALRAYKGGTMDRNTFILDDEWDKWFGMAPNREIIFLVDACHAGTFDRSFLSNKFKQKSFPASVQHGDDPIIDNQTSSSKQRQNVLIISAAADSETINEFKLNGVPRGLLSWSFANGMRGKADYNNNGTISRKELSLYIKRTINQKTLGKQKPDFLPRGAFSSDQPMLASTKEFSAKKGKLSISLQRIGNGEHVMFSTADNHYPYLTLFNITQNGAVQFLYPATSAEMKNRVRDIFNLNLKVDRTFTGNEKVVAIYSAQPQQQLHKLLQQLHNKPGGVRKLNAQKKRLLKGRYEEKFQKHHIKG